MGEDGGEEIGGVVGLHPGGLPGFERVGGRVGAAERIAAESVDEFPDRPDFFLVAAPPPGKAAEFDAHLFDFGVLNLDECPAEDIRASGRHAGEVVGDLEDVFLVGDNPVGGAEAALKRGVGERGGFDPEGAAGEGLFAQGVGGPRADDRHDGDEGVNIPASAHFFEAGHGRALDVVDAACAAGGDDVPDGRVFPRAPVVESHGNPAGGKRPGGVAEYRESALGEDIELHESDILDGVHVEVGGRPAFVAQEGGGEFVDRMPGENDSARMDLRVARKAVEKRCQPQGGLCGLVIEESVRSGGGDAGGFCGIPGRGKWQVLGQPAGLVVREPEDLGDFGERRARVERVESADRRNMAAGILLEQHVDDVVFPVVREIHVDIRQLVQRHPVPV